MSVQFQIPRRGAGLALEQKQEAASLITAAMPSMKGKCISNFSQSVMMMGIVAAVVGVSIAIFTSNTIAGIGFGMCGIVSLMGVYVIDGAEELKRMQASVDQLNQQERFFHGQTRLIDQAFKSVSKDTDRLEREGSLFKAQLQMLNATNSRLDHAYKELETALKLMGDAGGSYSKNREEIQKRVSEMKSFISQSQVALKEYKDTNVQFTGYVARFSRTVLGMGQVEEKIEKALNAFAVQNGDTPGTTEQVKNAEEIMGYLKTYLDAQHIDHMEVVHSFDKHFHTMESSLRDLTTLQQRIQQTSSFMEPTQQLIQQSSIALKKESESVSALVSHLTGNKEAIEFQRGEVAGQFQALKMAQDQILHLVQEASIRAEARLRDKEDQLQRIRISQEQNNTRLTLIEELQQRRESEQQQRHIALEERHSAQQLRQQSLQNMETALLEKQEQLRMKQEELVVQKQQAHESLAQKEQELAQQVIKVQQQHVNLKQLVTKVRKSILLGESQR
ncbi:MAG: hypothetical protein FJZ57_03595 [Chlamydiae bacterium]|nr:hypothetical protein [Chlamydiota bacterium]